VAGSHNSDQHHDAERHHQGGQQDIRQRQLTEAQRGRFLRQPVA
jgi:hypothetical protein